MNGLEEVDEDDKLRIRGTRGERCGYLLAEVNVSRLLDLLEKNPGVADFLYLPPKSSPAISPPPESGKP